MHQIQIAYSDQYAQLKYEDFISKTAQYILSKMNYEQLIQFNQFITILGFKEKGIHIISRAVSEAFNVSIYIINVTEAIPNIIDSKPTLESEETPSGIYLGYFGENHYIVEIWRKPWIWNFNFIQNYFPYFSDKTSSQSPESTLMSLQDLISSVMPTSEIILNNLNTSKQEAAQACEEHISLDRKEELKKIMPKNKITYGYDQFGLMKNSHSGAQAEDIKSDMLTDNNSFTNTKDTSSAIYASSFQDLPTPTNN